MTGITPQELHPDFRDRLFSSLKTETTLINGLNTVESTINSPVNVLRIDGRTITNLAPLFNSSAWTLQYGTVISPNEIELGQTAGLEKYIYASMGSLKNIPYTLSYKGNVLGHIDYYNGNTHLQRVPIASNPFTFTPPINNTHTSIAFDTIGMPNGNYRVKNVMVNEGSEPEPFVANHKGLTNATIVNETNNTSLVAPTTLYAGEYLERKENGDLVKHKRYHERLMDDSITYTVKASGTDHKIILVSFNQLPGIKTNSLFDNDVVMIKYDGTIMFQGTGSGLNYFNVANNGTDLSINVPNVDSGWGSNYIPTPEEIKAYFLGWKLYDANLPATRTSTYTRTDGLGKGWAMYDKSKGWQGELNLPTTKSTTGIDGNGGQYRLIYELITPVEEVIKPYGDLILEKGENSLKVYAGRIVNEFNKPHHYKAATYDRYEINTIANGLSPLKFNTNKILNVYENSKKSSEWVYEFVNEGGYERAIRNNYLHNPTASYTVDYEPLYTWEVTAPIDSMQLQYFESLQAVTNEHTHDVSKLQDTVKRMLENVVSEEEGLSWINATLLNGWLANNLVQYTKDKTGTVFLRGRITSGTTTDGTAVFYLPKGYIPKQSLFYKQRGADVYIENMGRVTIYGFSGAYFVIDGISFKAEM